MINKQIKKNYVICNYWLEEKFLVLIIRVTKKAKYALSPFFLLMFLHVISEDPNCKSSSVWL